MAISTVSTKGQITLPADMRRKLGLGPRDRVVLETTDDAIVIRKAEDFFALEGFLGRAKSSDEERRKMAAAVARRQKGDDA